MKNAAKQILIGIISGCASLASAESTNTEPLSLNQAYESALSRMETLSIAESEWRAAEARYRKSTGSFLPEINAFAGSTYKEIKDDAKSTTDTLDTGVNASWVIFNGFRTTRDSSARKTESEAYRFDLIRARQLLFEDVADIFYQTLALEREIELLNEKISALQKRIEELDKRVKLGRSRRAEMLASQTQLSDVESSLEQTKTSLRSSREIMAFLTGKEPASQKLSETSPLPEDKTMQELLSGRKEQRPDISAAEKRAESAAQDVKAADSDRGIKISADANWYAYRDPENGDWDLAVRAELPLFDGGIKRAEVKDRTEKARIQELKLAQLKRSADKDVRSAVIEFSGALAQWNSVRKAVNTAKENYDTQLKDSSLGRSSNLDVLTALVQYHDFRRRESSLEMQMRAALVHLQVAAGMEKK